ncbi:MAG: ATP-binding protein [Clostridia bacterium]|jgi:predicted AAA+ superfamily ATPase|nr:ATP-binding protein [Clostridia bacterium]
MYYRRELENKVIEMNKSFPVLLITGPRQVGKTTMLKKVAGDNRNYVTLDNPMIRELAKNDPGLFLESYPPPIIIDEIQYAPELLAYIKIYVDEKKEKGNFWLTGSQMFHLMKNVSESLAGRVGIINMLGFSTSEINKVAGSKYITNIDDLREKNKRYKKMDVKQVFERIYKGSMPALYEIDQDIESYYSSYLNTYIQRDIKELAQVGNELDFMKFMVACAARTSQMLNLADISRDIGITSQTAKRWLSILVSSGIVILVEAYSNNALKRVIKAPNLYFLDTGLCAYLTRWTSSDVLEVSAMSGAFFETYVVSEIVKSYYNQGKRPPIYYYRDKDQKEIDLIIEENNELSPIEIKKSSNPKKDAIKHFSILDKTKKNVGMGNVICLSQDLIPIDRSNYIVPVWLV